MQYEESNANDETEVGNSWGRDADYKFAKARERR